MRSSFALALLSVTSGAACSHPPRTEQAVASSSIGAETALSSEEHPNQLLAQIRAHGIERVWSSGRMENDVCGPQLHEDLLIYPSSSTTHATTQNRDPLEVRIASSGRVLWSQTQSNALVCPVLDGSRLVHVRYEAEANLLEVLELHTGHRLFTWPSADRILAVAMVQGHIAWISDATPNLSHTTWHLLRLDDANRPIPESSRTIEDAVGLWPSSQGFFVSLRGAPTPSAPHGETSFASIDLDGNPRWTLALPDVASAFEASDRIFVQTETMDSAEVLRVHPDTGAIEFRHSIPFTSASHLIRRTRDTSFQILRPGSHQSLEANTGLVRELPLYNPYVGPVGSENFILPWIADPQGRKSIVDHASTPIGRYAAIVGHPNNEEPPMIFSHHGAFAANASIRVEHSQERPRFLRISSSHTRTLDRASVLGIYDEGMNPVGLCWLSDEASQGEPQATWELSPEGPRWVALEECEWGDDRRDPAASLRAALVSRPEVYGATEESTEDPPNLWFGATWSEAFVFAR